MKKSTGSSFVFTGGAAGGGGAVNWGLPDTVNGAVNGILNFAAGGAGYIGLGTSGHGGIEFSYGAGGNSPYIATGTPGKDGGPGAVIVRYVIWQ